MKVSIFLKGEKLPITMENFEEVHASDSATGNNPSRLIPDRLFISPEKSYVFVGHSGSISVLGSELQAVHFEK